MARTATDDDPVVAVGEARCRRPGCGHRWVPRVRRPLRCPACQAKRWWESGTRRPGPAPKDGKT